MKKGTWKMIINMIISNLTAIAARADHLHATGQRVCSWWPPLEAATATKTNCITARWQDFIVAGVNSAKGWHGFILVLEGFSWLQYTCNEQIRNQRKPNKTKIKPITMLFYYYH